MEDKGDNLMVNASNNFNHIQFVSMVKKITIGYDISKIICFMNKTFILCIKFSVFTLQLNVTLPVVLFNKYRKLSMLYLTIRL